MNNEDIKAEVKESVIDKVKPLHMVYATGCTCDELSVNGISEIDMTDEQRYFVIFRIMKWYNENPENLNNLLQYFIEANYDNFESSGPCECCGDSVWTFKKTL